MFFDVHLAYFETSELTKRMKIRPWAKEKRKKGKETP